MASLKLRLEDSEFHSGRASKWRGPSVGRVVFLNVHIKRVCLCFSGPSKMVVWIPFSS